MNQRTYDALEYHRVRDEISSQCMSAEGKAEFLTLEPSRDPDEVRRVKALASAWLGALSDEDPPRLLGWEGVGGFLSKLKVEGASLDCRELYTLGQFCKSTELIRSWALRKERQRDELTAPLARFASSLPDLSAPERDIFRVIDPATGEVRDLPELKAIRASIRKIRQDIERLIGSYLADDGLRGALQSTLPTIRDGREVIALKANFRSRVRGIVHEVSQSGQTVYVEPDDVVDRNNDLVSEEARLAREIARILRELTAALSPSYTELLEARASMVFLDRVSASARWGKDHRCSLAGEARSGDSPLKLVKARHPLLGAKAVPIDLSLPASSRVLIITGPNTGGKTVSLKTAALFALMNQTGWPIPAERESELGVFDFIGSDIGDEQSLDQSLSTFSGHMKNISEILSSATERSLVLLDELGSGTDPQEGSAIAMAVLDELLDRGSVVLATTHHGILKNYGYTHERCVNASVDFDQNTLSPTYRILMGVPGESHALDIAYRNGLDADVVDRARAYLAEERADVSALIKGLTAKHEELAGFEEKKKKEEASLREKRRKTDLKELQLRQRELELREQGYRRLDSMLSESRKELENLVRLLKEGELTREKTLEVKAWMADFADRVSEEHEGLVAERAEVRALAAEGAEREVGASRERVPLGGDRGPSAASAVPLAPGSDVFIGPSRRRGTIVRAEKGGRWVVASGPIRMTVREDELTPAPAQGHSPKGVSVEIHADMGAEDSPVFELKLIGMRHDEAMKALNRQLDLACLKGLKEFSVVHGKGHGILQSAVHQALSSSRAVAEFFFARPEDGGSGKTIVRLG